MMSDHLASRELVVSSYVELRSRIIDLVRSTPEQSGDLIVPACPEWNVRQLVSHLVGVPEDILTGNMEGVTTEVWTAAQVARHAGKSLDELAESYELTGQVFDDVLPRISEPMNSQMVMDAVTHELDLREALGDLGSRNSSAVDVALGWLRYAFESRMPVGTFDPLDEGDPGRYNLLRSLTGRRSVVEMNSLGLDGAAIAVALQGTPISVPI
jgi:uncharacterized protein (TIGR03083 family)